MYNFGKVILFLALYMAFYTVSCGSFVTRNYRCADHCSQSNRECSDACQSLRSEAGAASDGCNDRYSTCIDRCETLYTLCRKNCNAEKTHVNIYR